MKIHNRKDGLRNVPAQKAAVVLTSSFPREDMLHLPATWRWVMTVSPWHREGGTRAVVISLHCLNEQTIYWVETSRWCQEHSEMNGQLSPLRRL